LRGLIVKTHAFGDALTASPAAAALVSSGGEWTALAGPSSAEVWRRLPGLRSVIEAPFPAPGVLGAARLVLWTAASARALGGFDMTVVMHASPGVRRWIRLATGAPSRSGGRSPLGAWEKVSPLDSPGFAAGLYARIAGAGVDSFRPVFAVLEREREAARGMIGEGRFLAVAPGGGRNPRDTVPEKRWAPERFADVIRRASARGLKAVLLGDSHDRASAGAVSRLAGAAVAADLTGRTGWGEAAAVMQRCRAFVGPDSGLAHLACAAGLPAVVLFGPTDPDSLYAPGLIEAVRTDSPCSPCYSNSVFRGCRTGRGDCMFRIEPGRVWSTLERILDEDERG